MLVYYCRAVKTRNMDTSMEKAVQKLVVSKKQVITACVDDESGEIVFSGDNKWIEALEDDIDLKEALEKKLKEAISEKDEYLVKESLPAAPVHYEKLNFDIAEPKKACQKKIREYLNKMLVVQGFGKNKAKRYGKGPPPKGWPVAGFPWAEFKGASNTNNLTTGAAVGIISSMLTWAGYNPKKYVEAEAGMEAEGGAGVDAGVGVDAGGGVGAGVEADTGVEAETGPGAGG